MRYRTLGSGDPSVSELGFGASPLGGIYGTFAEQDGIAAVHAALEAGINFLDVSPYYGLTAAETVLGKALRGIGRDQYVLATKVGRYGDDAVRLLRGPGRPQRAREHGAARRQLHRPGPVPRCRVRVTGASCRRGDSRAPRAAGDRARPLGRGDWLPAASAAARRPASAGRHGHVVLPLHRAGRAARGQDCRVRRGRPWR